MLQRKWLLSSFFKQTDAGWLSMALSHANIQPKPPRRPRSLHGVCRKSVSKPIQHHSIMEDLLFSLTVWLWHFPFLTEECSGWDCGWSFPRTIRPGMRKRCFKHATTLIFRFCSPLSAFSRLFLSGAGLVGNTQSGCNYVRKKGKCVSTWDSWVTLMVPLWPSGRTFVAAI